MPKYGYQISSFPPLLACTLSTAWYMIKIGLWGIDGRIMATGNWCTRSTTCPRDSLFTANAIRTGLRSRSRLRGDRPTNWATTRPTARKDFGNKIVEQQLKSGASNSKTINMPDRAQWSGESTEEWGVWFKDCKHAGHNTMKRRVKRLNQIFPLLWSTFFLSERASVFAWYFIFSIHARQEFYTTVNITLLLIIYYSSISVYYVSTGLFLSHFLNKFYTHF